MLLCMAWSNRGSPSFCEVPAGPLPSTILPLRPLWAEPLAMVSGQAVGLTNAESWAWC